MRDMSGAQCVPAGSSLGITPASSGGSATLPRAPGHERPRTAPSGAARHGRLSAASTAPGYDVPRTTPVRAPGYDCQSAAPRAPGPDVPLATTARTPRHDRLSAAQLVPEYNRSGATLAAASVPDYSPVSLPLAPGHDCSRRAPIASGSLSASVTHSTNQEETVYDRLFTATELRARLEAATAPLLAAEIRVLQVLIYRHLARGPAGAPSRNRRRAAAVRRRQRTLLLQQLAAICQAVDVLQRALKTQQALAQNSPAEQYPLPTPYDPATTHR